MAVKLSERFGKEIASGHIHGRWSAGTQEKLDGFVVEIAKLEAVAEAAKTIASYRRATEFGQELTGDDAYYLQALARTALAALED